MIQENEEKMKEWKLVKTILLNEDAIGISCDKGDNGQIFDFDELYVIGKIIADGEKADITFFKSENYSYGQNVFTLADILPNAAGNTGYFSLTLKKVPGNVNCLCFYNKYNSSVGLNHKMTCGNLGACTLDKFSRFDLAVWSSGAAGLFKAGSSFEIYAR